VFEQIFHLGRGKVRCERLFFFFALTSALAILSSCGSSSTAVTPTITMSCDPTDVTLLGTSQCTATVLNESSTLVNWTVTGTGPGPFGSITSGGLYTAPKALPMSGASTENVITITAVSQVASTLTTTQNLTLVLPTAIQTVTCVDANSVVATIVSSGNRISCTATASTGAIVPVNWSVANTNFPNIATNLGSISTQGIYTAPLVPPPGQSVTITATSQALATETMTTTATVVYGNNVFNNESFAFSTSGRLPNKAFWARVGSFSAGGGALIGTEDTNQGGTPNIVTTQRPFTGSYSIGPDGRGTMQFCEDTSIACPTGVGKSATAYFNIVVVSPTEAQIIEFSKPGTSAAFTIAGGEMVAQDPSVFSGGDGSLSGTYSFDFYGVSTSNEQEDIVGEFEANGHGTISAGSSTAPLTPGQLDINSGGVLSQAPVATTTYSISSAGRGTVTLNGLTFSFYPVSASRARFIEIDPVPPSAAQSSILLGDAFEQQTSSTCGWAMNALSGSTILQSSGINLNGGAPGVVIADVGDFSADGTAGNVTAASIDENSGGTVSSAVGTLTGNYVMNACGRGTLNVGSHTYVYYSISPSDAVLLETTTGIIAHGFLVPSSGGPFVDGTLTGSYSFRFGGSDTAGNREDFLGQMTSPGTGKALTGTLDLNDFGATQADVTITNPGGTYTANPAASPAGDLRGTMSIPLNTAPSATTRNWVLYMVNPNLFYGVDVDPSPAGSALGVIENQF
jgi:hypothetical protein